MGIVKFTLVKLMPKYFLLFCFIILFSLQGNGTVKYQKTIPYFQQKNRYQFEINYNTSNNNLLLVAVSSVLYAQNAISEQETNTTSKNVNQSELIEKQNPENSILRVFFIDDEITSLKKRLTDYGKNHLPAGLRPGYNAIIEKAFEYPLILLFLILVLFFIINIIVVFGILNKTIKRKSNKERFELIYSKMYEEVLMAYMFGSIDWETALLKLKKYNRRENRKILVSVLMNFKSNFKGELEHFIPEIYTKLGLQNDSLKLAKSYYNYKKVKGIIELIHLYPEGAKDIVKKLINDPNDYVRAEAQTAYIRLNPEAPFDFFYNLERPFTRWTQLSAFNLIRIHQLSVPSFGQFLNSKHYNIKNFSLRMITFFQQLESAPEVVKMVESDKEQTRYLAYRAINDLRLYDSHELIKSKFKEETLRNKIEIVKALKNIGVEEDFNFLEDILKTESVSLKTEACRAMYFMSPKSKEKLMQMNKEDVPEIELLISHVTDPRN